MRFTPGPGLLKLSNFGLPLRSCIPLGRLPSRLIARGHRRAPIGAFRWGSIRELCLGGRGSNALGQGDNQIDKCLNIGLLFSPSFSGDKHTRIPLVDFIDIALQDLLLNGRGKKADNQGSRSAFDQIDRIERGIAELNIDGETLLNQLFIAVFLTANSQYKMFMNDIGFGFGPAFGGAARASGGKGKAGGQTAEGAGGSASLFVDHNGGILSAESIGNEFAALGAFFILAENDNDNKSNDTYRKGDGENDFHTGNTSQ